MAGASPGTEPGHNPHPCTARARAPSGEEFCVARGRVMAATATDAPGSVRGRELDAVDAAADAEDVVERVGMRGIVGLEWKMDVADRECGVVRGGG